MIINDYNYHYGTYVAVLLHRRITTLLPKQKELWEQGGDQEAMATKMNKQKLQELEDTQKVCLSHVAMSCDGHVMCLADQSIKKRLEELDQQTLAIDAHIMLASKATPLADEEVGVCD